MLFHKGPYFGKVRLSAPPLEWKGFCPDLGTDLNLPGPSKLGTPWSVNPTFEGTHPNIFQNDPIGVGKANALIRVVKGEVLQQHRSNRVDSEGVRFERFGLLLGVKYIEVLQPTAMSFDGDEGFPIFISSSLISQKSGSSGSLAANHNVISV